MDSIELSRLTECERVIERGMKTFTEVGAALMEIREGKLYRQDFGTFEDYCRERWNFTQQYATGLIRATNVIENLKTETMVSVFPVSERQARPLTRLEPEQQRQAWQQVIDTAPNGKITAALVIEAAKTIQNERREERRAERFDKLSEISAGEKPLSTPRKYNVIYADPPWRYDYSVSTSREIENQYPTMNIEDICNLPVGEIASPDSILFMWGTSPKLAEAMRVIEAWGFTYKTCAVWVKDKIGMGYYFRQQHELLLVATKGNIPAPAPDARVSSVIDGDRTEHSKKPFIVYEIIENMYGDLPKIELFCRNPQPGWDVWGNQA